MKKLLPLVLLGAPLFGGCLALAAAGVGVVLSQEFSDHAHIAYLEEHATQVWASAKTSMAHMSTQEEIEIDEELMAASARIDGAVVTVHVEAWDVGETRLSIGAKKYGLYNSDVAERVLVRIRKDLGR